MGTSCRLRWDRREKTCREGMLLWRAETRATRNEATLGGISDPGLLLFSRQSSSSDVLRDLPMKVGRYESRPASLERR